MPRAPAARQSEPDPMAEKIPRPPNAWIIYRTDRLNEWRLGRSPNDPPVKQADISRLISKTWKVEPDHVKLEYEKRAAIAKAEHKKKYPDYKYTPISKETKEKMRAIEREAKKRAREEAKAAKLASRRTSGRVASGSSVPSSSNVRLEVFEEVKALPAPDHLNRGCGPSPPIDYDPESSSSASSTPLPSSSSSLSRSSPLPSSSSHPRPTRRDAPPAWLHPSSSPAASPPNQPPPAYPSSFVPSPAASRQSSYNFSPGFPSSASTPSDSPPSYTEGEGWQPQAPASGYQSFAPLPESQNDWASFSHYSPHLQPDLTFPAPAIDPLLSLPAHEQVSFDAAAPGVIFDLSTAQPASAQSPPGELDFQQLLDQITAVNNAQSLNSNDQLAPMLDMAEFYECVEDNADDAGMHVPNDLLMTDFSSFTSWVNTHPHEAATLADPNFYPNMSHAVAQVYPQLAANFQLPPMSANVHGAPSNFATDAFQMFDFTMQQQAQPELAMPIPTVPIAVQDMSTVPTQPSSHQASFDGVTTRRYVPPSGAGMPARRRVAGKFQPRQSDFEDDSA